MQNIKNESRKSWERNKSRFEDCNFIQRNPYKYYFGDFTNLPSSRKGGNFVNF